MEIRAYNEDYLTGTQRVLGDAVDFAVMTLGIDPDAFGNALAVCDASKQLASGNPKYTVGMNGCEFARLVLTQTYTTFSDAPDEMYMDKSPEYWAGWALAFFQWHSSLSFGEILSAVSLSNIIEMYPLFHEMDIMQFCDRMYKTVKSLTPDTRLKTKRENSGLSQSELAQDSGVPVRQIQLFEQRQRDINKTAAETLLRLSRSLCCDMEDLIEL